MSEKVLPVILCAVLRTIGGKRCKFPAVEGDPDGLCKQHRQQIEKFGARAWAVYAGYATHFKHVVGDDVRVPSVSKAAAEKYGLHKANSKQMTALEEAKLEGETRKSTKKSKSKKHRALDVMAKDIAKMAAEIKQAAPVAEAPVVPEIKTAPAAAVIPVAK
jgi:hypothetical protein